MGFFDAIPNRDNGDDIEASWFNIIKTFLNDFEASIGVSGQQSFAAAASQTDADVTGLIFDSLKIEAARVEYFIKTATLFEKGYFDVIWNGSAWSLYNGQVIGDDSKITFSSIHATTGQVRYTSDVQTGTIKFKSYTITV